MSTLGDRTGQRIGFGVAALVFASWAYFQLNDPDAVPWVVYYGGLALGSGLAAAGTRRIAVRAALGVWAVWGLAWALWVLVGAARTAGLGVTFGAFLDDAGEPAREALGLLVGAVWAVLLARWLRPPPAVLERGPMETVEK